MTEPRFAKLNVSTQFQLDRNPREAIYAELARTYSIDILALDGSIDLEGWQKPVKVGSMQVQLLRFDCALNLGLHPALVGDAHSEVALELYERMEADIDQAGLHRDTLLLQSIAIEPSLKGNEVEREAIRAALIGLSTGISSAFLLLDPNLNPGELNAETLRFAPLGFKPVELGSNLLWISLESAEFWRESGDLPE